MNSKKAKALGVWLQVLFVALTPIFGFEKAHAAVGNLGLAVVQLGRMTPAVADNQIMIIAKPTTTASEAFVKITFNGYTVNSTPANIHVTTTGIPTTFKGAGVTAWPGIGTAATGVATTAVSFASTDLTVGTQYAFIITSGITNPVAGPYEVTIETQATGPTTIDQAQVGTRIIANDQIAINAVVPPTFNFTLSGNTDNFTTDLDPASVTNTTGINVTVTTNAAHGWVAWTKSLHGALVSATSGTNIPGTGSVDGAPSSLSAGTSGYVINCSLVTDAVNGTGAVTIDPEYLGGANQGGTPSTSYQTIASATGTTDGDVIKLTERAAINGTQPAATDYSDTLTVIGAGAF